MSEASPDTDRLSRQLDELLRRVAVLHERANQGESAELLEQAFTELSVTVEELRVAEEEIRQQADELQGTYLLLEAERQRYRDLFDFAPDGYLVTDGLGVLREANQAAARLLNRPVDFVLGKPLAVYVSAKHVGQFRRELARVAEGNQVRVWETCLEAKGGQLTDVECTVAPARDPLNGRLLELRWRLNDISERKQAETALHISRETLRELSGRLEAVREEERLSIARAVHDEIGAALTAIKMDVAQVRQGLGQVSTDPALVPELHARTDDIYTTIDTTMETVRRIAKELRPAVLDDFGLVAALDWQLNEFQKRSGLACGLSVAPGSAQLDKSTATAVFRVFQEMLTNIARHAQATRADVRLYEKDQHLVLEVRDNGRGIRAEEIAGSGSLGLLGMRERVRLRGGTLEVEGKPDEGTLVRVTVPLGAARGRGDA